MASGARPGQSPDDDKATGGHSEQPGPYEVPQPPLHAIAHDGIAHGFAHDETRTHRKRTLPARVRVRTTAQMDDETPAPAPASPAHHVREILAPPQPVLGREHRMDPSIRRRLRPTAGRGPCCGGP